jgi:protease-4
MDDRNSSETSRMRRALIYSALIFALLFIIAISLYVILAGVGNLGLAQNRVEVIYVQGIMLTGSFPEGFGYVTSEDIAKNLKEASEDSGIKAIVLRINSPGGSPAAAEEIVAEMKKIDKPIVVSMGDVAASAAYYISVPADRIVANPDTITGSIGVIWAFANRTEFYDKEGTSFYISKSGELKDMGADWRGLTDTEKQYADQTIREVYERFVNEVAADRNMSISEVKDLADGRVYTGAKARELGLVDELGGFEDGISLAAKLGGISGKPTVTYANKPSLSRLLFGGDIKQYTRYFDESPYGRMLSMYLGSFLGQAVRVNKAEIIGSGG